ncbi:MAG: UV DNA damage repair endonuclease UvsE [Nitrosopumilus sp.]
MKIGYACQNKSLSANTNNTFRLASYSESKIKNTVERNFKELFEILEYNIQNKILFFRIGSSFIPFASHPICKFNWEKHFEEEFLKAGEIIKENKFRVSMHPGQFVVLNSKRRDVVESSIRELEYHSRLLDLMKLDSTAKIQIHMGFPQGDKEKAKKDFVKNFEKLSDSVKKRLVIENDEHYFSADDCIEISKKLKIPIVFDTFHYSILNDGRPLSEIFDDISKTWKSKDGLPMLDYSSQDPKGREGKHCSEIDIVDFQKTMLNLSGKEFDLMLEIKNKEKSVIKVLEFMSMKTELF